RLIKRELAPLGQKSGRILFRGTDTDSLDAETAACRIGYVMQSPEQQIVTDKVWSELAFGLENMGLKTSAIRRKVAEISGYFGIEPWFEKNVSELSGGQKQLLCLAAVMIMEPDILLLDEPTAQLDPISASEFLHTVYKLSRDLSLTVICIEHRLEDVIPLSDRLFVLDGGRLAVSGKTGDAIKELAKEEALSASLPTPVRVFAALGGDECPLTINEGRRYIGNWNSETNEIPEARYDVPEEPALEFRGTFFRYAKELPDVISGLDVKIGKGEIFGIVGGNGSGKTTLLSVAAGLYRPYAGSVKVFGKDVRDYKNGTLYKNCLSMLPQNVQTVFLKNTVREELAGCESGVAAVSFDFSPLLDMHPYDLSGGEQQLVALAKVLSSDPRLLLLDEPTKWLDAGSKARIISILRRFKEKGVTCVIVTHDIEFAAEACDRAAMFFRGEILSCDTPRKFFPGNSYYTTAACRMTRGIYKNAVTPDDIIDLCRKNGRRPV
ncbi:MAG: ATP-binding cassette domain-containing protein, partial [Clostridia bacterium]|nr:ATP-binding cassette domain-containing protein [Clostridia bacterium]